MTILKLELKLEWEPSNGGHEFELCSVGPLSNEILARVFSPSNKHHENFGQWWGVCTRSDNPAKIRRGGKWFPTCEEAQAYALKGAKRYIKKRGGKIVEIW